MTPPHSHTHTPTHLPTSAPTTLIIRTAGTNCDRELAHAFELAGSKTTTVHLNRLVDRPDLLSQVDLIGLPGGFSYGDDIAAGRIFAIRLRYRLLEPLLAAIDRGVPIIGICNGFQVLVKLGLLPDPQSAGRQTVTLAENCGGRFIDQWVHLEVAGNSRCIWTRHLKRLELPIAHREGRFVVESPTALQQLQERGQVVLRYVPAGGGTGLGQTGDSAGNPNGSVDSIAGICDPTGLVLGLMPHPERYTDRTHHPNWLRLGRPAPAPPPSGLQLVHNAVEYVQGVEPSWR